jgi:hypothetical protein
MNEFTASNGYYVIRNGATFGIDRSRERAETLAYKAGGYWLGQGEDAALAEFFQHERDEHLNRWRWSENPDYVVYPFSSNSVSVIRETPYTTWTVNRAAAGSANVEPWRCAQAYFDAHPEPKPWHDAKPGEVWELTIGAGVRRVFVHDDESAAIGDRAAITPDGKFVELDSPDITAGRRIWPEGD